jgi:hypothetical protein
VLQIPVSQKTDVDPANSALPEQVLQKLQEPEAEQHCARDPLFEYVWGQSQDRKSESASAICQIGSIATTFTVLHSLSPLVDSHPTKTGSVSLCSSRASGVTRGSGCAEQSSASKAAMLNVKSFIADNSSDHLSKTNGRNNT